MCINICWNDFLLLFLKYYPPDVFFAFLLFLTPEGCHFHSRAALDRSACWRIGGGAGHGLLRIRRRAPRVPGRATGVCSRGSASVLGLHRPCPSDEAVGSAAMLRSVRGLAAHGADVRRTAVLLGALGNATREAMSASTEAEAVHRLAEARGRRQTTPPQAHLKSSTGRGRARERRNKLAVDLAKNY